MTALKRTFASGTATLLAAGVVLADEAGAQTTDPTDASPGGAQQAPVVDEGLPASSGSARAPSSVTAGPGATIQATDSETTCFKGYGCSFARITCEWIPGATPITACVGEGEAIRYPAGASLWVDYILYGPGFSELDSGRRQCRTARPCDIEGAAALAYIRGDFAMCVHSWVAGNDNQPMACARVVT